MATTLSTREESFIRMMQKSVEHAQHGFQLLAQRDDAARYFDPVLAAGLLAPSNNPSPVAVPDKPGFSRIPYWRALDYLEKVAQLADQRNDIQLGRKILAVVQAVTIARQPDGTAVDNHYTFWKFAQILGLVPVGALTDDVIALVPSWLHSKYDRSLAGQALSEGLMRRLLASDLSADLHRACLLLDYCTDFDRDGTVGADLSTVIDDYWLKDMFAKHLKIFGTKAGASAAGILARRVRTVYSDERRPYQSSLWRPAIEEHEQNYDWRGPDNRFVEGLRDVLLAWTDTGDLAVRTFVSHLLSDGLDIMRRIALHVIDERFDRFSGLVDPTIDVSLFKAPYRHELHRLLSRHFAEMSNLAKDAVIGAIRRIPTPSSGKERARRRKHEQRGWASAIREKDYPPADALFEELDTALGSNTLSEHPDFLSFHETRWGPGPSPFTADILIAAAKDDTLLEKIGNFEPGDSWRGPTEEGLWATLEAAAARAPDVFVRRLDAYATASIPVIHATIAGLRKSLELPGDTKPLVSRAKLWPVLLDFFETVLERESFWANEGSEPERFIARRGWVLSAIADTLMLGTRDDKTAFAQRLLPQARRILEILLERAPGMTEIGDSDVTTSSMNTPRGRAIEALVNHALRVCRLASRKNKSHVNAWEDLEGIFDAQLLRSRGGNFEFSALMATYVANLDYLSADWLDTNFDKIFDKTAPDNFDCALAGLRYAKLTRRVYKLLASHGIVIAAIDQKYDSGREAHRIVEFMCLALLWGDEDLESPQFSKLFESGGEDRLVAATIWLWSVRSNKLTKKQKKIILAFWSEAVDWARQQSEKPKSLLSHLGRLAIYITDIDAKVFSLLNAVAPFVGVDFNYYEFIKELTRLAPQYPVEVSDILGVALRSSKPNYDMNNHLKNLLGVLAGCGQRAAVLEYINQLMQTLPNMLEFYGEISQGK